MLDSEQDLASREIVPAEPGPLASSEGRVGLNGGSADMLELAIASKEPVFTPTRSSLAACCSRRRSRG